MRSSLSALPVIMALKCEAAGNGSTDGNVRIPPQNSHPTPGFQLSEKGRERASVPGGLHDCVWAKANLDKRGAAVSSNSALLISKSIAAP